MSNSFPLPDDHDELDKLWDDPRGSICWICHEFELFDGEPYSVCFECGHVYQTSEDLVRSYGRFVEWVWDGPPDLIPFCGACLHDF